MLKQFIKANFLLIGIIVIAATLRLVGTNPGYNSFHSDEGITYSAATSMIKNNNLDPLRYDYPALVPLINYLSYQSFFIPVSWGQYYLSNFGKILDGTIHLPIAPLEAKRVFQVFILGERERNALFWGRYTTALIAILDVFLTYILAKKIFGKNAGLLSALFLTFHYKSVVNSHIGLPDIYNAFFVLLVLITCINLINKPNLSNYIAAGLSVGLSFSVKYQVFAFFPFLLSHLYVSLKNNEYKQKIKKLINPYFIASCLLIPLVFLITNPYFSLYIDDALKITSGVSEKYGMGTKKINLYPLSYFFNIDFGPIAFTLIPIGMLVAIKRNLKPSLLFFVYLIPFAFIFLYYSRGGFYVRNFITIAPLLCIFISLSVLFFYEILNRKINNKIAFVFTVLLIIVSIYVPARNSIINSYSYTKPWSYDVLRKWEQTFFTKDTVVAAHPFDPLAAAPNVKIKRTEYEIAGSYSLAEHRENGAEFALVNLNWASNSFYFWMNFGPNEVDKFWFKPINMMRNTFHGIATEETFRYQVFQVTKPWQAPDANLILAKLPKYPNVKMKNIKMFSFDKDLNNWETKGNLSENTKDFDYSIGEGNIGKGSIVFLATGNKYPDRRIVSEPLEIKPGHLYKVNAYLKTEKNLSPRERDGFIRVDFYKRGDSLNGVGVTSSVSARIFGTTKWVQKSILERAPDDADLMTVSFSVYDRVKGKIWLDDVSIEESEEKIADITKDHPYDIKPIDINLLYVESHGNL